MKKVLSIMLASAFALGAIGLAACGDSDNGGGKGEINAKTDPSTIVSEKVADEAAWRAAFDYSDITRISAAIEQWQSEGNTKTMIYGGIAEIDGDKAYTSMSQSRIKLDPDTKEPIAGANGDPSYDTVEQQRYWYTDNETHYRLDKNNKEWLRTESSYGASIDMLGLNIYDDVRDNFSKATYDEALKAYTCSLPTDRFEGEEVYDLYEIRIVGGKAVYMSLYYGYTYNEKAITSFQGMLLYNVGKTTVKVPITFTDAVID